MNEQRKYALYYFGLNYDSELIRSDADFIWYNLRWFYNNITICCIDIIKHCVAWYYQALSCTDIIKL